MGGADKLLEKVDGVPILRRTALEAIRADLGPIVVGLRPDDRGRKKALRNLPVEIIQVPDAEAGLSATLKAGAEWAIAAILAHKEDDYEYSGMCILLPDMPEVTCDDLNKIDRAFQASGGACIRSITADGQPGHPTVFPLHVLRDFEVLTGDQGAASMFEAERVELVALGGNRARLDLDTPEDWAAWRARR